MKLIRNLFVDIESKTIKRDLPFYIIDILKNKNDKEVIKKGFMLLIKDNLSENKKHDLVKYLCNKKIFFLENRLDVFNYIINYPNVELVEYLIKKDFLGHKKINTDYKKQIKIVGSFSGDSVGFKINPSSVYRRLRDNVAILDDIVDFQKFLLEKELSYNKDLICCLQLIFDRVELIFNDELRKNCLLWYSYQRSDGKGLSFRLKDKYCNIPLDKKSQENFILSIMACKKSNNSSNKVVL